MGDNPGANIVYCDYSQKITVAIEITDRLVTHIPLNVSEGIRVVRSGVNDFHRTYRPLLNYPVERALGVYLNYLRFCGASHDALLCIKSIIPEMDMEECSMAAEKGKKTAAAKSKEPAAPKPKRESAASMFQDLIMEGGKTDDEIFKLVQEKFGLDDGKRGYVGWYRNYLKKKKGLNPPDAIKPVKEKKSTEAKPKAKDKAKK